MLVRFTSIRKRMDRRRANRDLRRRYGISIERYDALLESQGGVCAICLLPERAIAPRSDTVIALSVDHEYDTGTVRGLLCQTCNRALGYLKDREDLLLRAALYLEEFRNRDNPYKEA
jgi:hypothetical protein